ncbi:PREDICTED: enhancer of split mdelta protein [Rhagoletis zephyria]|uniref:enhancer of split mdelta protein n=1 Tax=Rhagoletis zephyria TaxID=28612 RepID=UPI0008114BD4|nr:PREDICTED: enhancer of split mdelta protein [Rhagoletis zephyria]
MAVDGQRFMTKTQHYRKVTKPLLERKRRARMNLYLDELKDLIVDTMEAQGEHIAKLEKADILELTVNYLRTHKHEIAASVAQHQSALSGGPAGRGVNVEKFRAGYTQAAYEVSRVFATVPGLDVKFGTKLMKHLGYQLKDLQQVPLALPPPHAARAMQSPASGEEALNLEVVKRADAISPTAAYLDAEYMRRAYQQQQQQQQQQQHQQLQQQMCGNMQRMKEADAENGGECLWRPW